MASNVRNRRFPLLGDAQLKRAVGKSATRSLRGAPILDRSQIPDEVDIERLYADHWAACRRDPRYAGCRDMTAESFATKPQKNGHK